MIILTEAWLIEIAKGTGKLFLNPLFYWSFILVAFAGYKRIKQERIDFGFKVFDVFSEWKKTWLFSLVTGLLLSLIISGAGMVFSYGSLILVCFVAIILSLTFRFTLLSASYTIGISYLLLLFLPFLLENQTYVDGELFTQTNFTSLAILLGLLLIVEAILLSRLKRNESFPGLVLGSRGAWVGQHRVKKLSFIPFFALVPAGMITPFAPFWPYFSIGETSYSLVLIPFIIGFDYLIRGSLPRKAAIKLANATTLLGIIVLLVAIGSIFVFWLSLAAVLIAIIGREYMRYYYRMKDRQALAYFHQLNNGLKVLSVIPGTPADNLEILVGETITKVNGKKVNTVTEFYSALQDSGAFFKLDLVDDSGELRFLQSAFYEGDHHELGLIFTSEPYRVK